MRLLARNKQTVYYCTYTTMTPIKVTDTDIETGEYEKTYGSVKSFKAYIKSAIGNNTVEPFGDFTSKNRTIYIDYGVADDIDEFCLLWIGIDPTVVSGVPTVPHNFTVDGVARGLNHIRVSISQVEVDG